MSQKVGRPTIEKKNNRESFRLSDSDMEKLNFCMTYGKMTKTDVIRIGIDKVYNEIRATDALRK